MRTVSQAPVSRVFIVDDDAPTRTALSGLLQSTCRTEDAVIDLFESAEQFLAHVDSDPHGCLVLDLQLKGKSGLELLAIIRNRGWELPTLVVSGEATVADAMEAVKFGVLDFFEKPIQHEKLATAVDLALSVQPGEKVLPNRCSLQMRVEKLAEIELEVLRMLLEGRANKSIAYRLDIGLRSVVRYRKHILEKLEFKTLPELVRALTMTGLANRGSKNAVRNAPLSQRLRHDLRSKLNSVVLNLRLYQIQKEAEHFDAAAATLAQVDFGLQDLVNDPCLVAPSCLASDKGVLPVAVVALNSINEASLLVGLIENNELHAEVCTNLTDTIEAIKGQRALPAFVVMEYLPGSDMCSAIVRLLNSLPNSDKVNVLVFSDMAEGTLPADVCRRMDRFYSRPLDTQTFNAELLDCLVSGS